MRNFGGGWARGRRWERCAFFSTEAAGSPSLCSLVESWTLLPHGSPGPALEVVWPRSWAYSPAEAISPPCISPGLGGRMDGPGG